MGISKLVFTKWAFFSFLPAPMRCSDVYVQPTPALKNLLASNAVLSMLANIVSLQVGFGSCSSSTQNTAVSGFMTACFVHVGVVSTVDSFITRETGVGTRNIDSFCLVLHLSSLGHVIMVLGMPLLRVYDQFCLSYRIHQHL